MLAKLTLSVKILLCRVSHIFPPLAGGLVVVRLVARMAFATGEVVLLPVMATLLVRTRHPGLSSLVASRWSAGSVALCSVIADSSRLFSVSTGSSAGLLFGSLTRCTIRVPIT